MWTKNITAGFDYYVNIINNTSQTGLFRIFTLNVFQSLIFLVISVMYVKLSQKKTQLDIKWTWQFHIDTEPYLFIYFLVWQQIASVSSRSVKWAGRNNFPPPTAAAVEYGHNVNVALTR